MKISSPILALSAPWLPGRLEKIKSLDSALLDFRNNGWGDGGVHQQSLNQANGVTSLHGLVVHGAACASLLALGSMAAMGRETSYELLMANAVPMVPTAEFVGQWPTATVPPQFADHQDSVKQSNEDVAIPEDAVAEPLETLLIDLSAPEQMITQQDNSESNVMEMLSPLELNTDDLTPPPQQESSWVNPPVIKFVFEVMNQQQESLLDSPVTQDNNPTFSGQAQPNSLVEVLNHQGELLGSSLVDASGHWHISLVSPLPNGEHDLSLYVTDNQGLRELAAPPIHLVIAVEPVSLEVQPLIDAGLINLMPIIESEPLINLNVIAQDEDAVNSITFNFGLSELLPISEQELLFNEPMIAASESFDESALQLLIHPQGGITMWQQKEELAINEQTYSPTATQGLDSEWLLDNPLADNTY